jgi:phthalate 4,5-cis-dihydrodiol dehydrogenase
VKPDWKSTQQKALRIGVVGLGRAFSLMLPTFVGDSRVRLVAACDVRREPLDQFTSDFGGAAHADMEGLARDPNVDVVYIASPHQFHADHTEIAAANGKHVLVEKPMALSLAECDRMIACAENARVALVVGHCHSFDTPYLRTRDIVRSGEFGAVKMIHALNYTDYLYRPRRPEELATSAGGGAVFSQAAHQVDMVRMLAGAPATRIRATVSSWDPLRPTEGAYAALIWFGNGAFASLTYSGYAHFDSDEWSNWVGEMGEEKDSAEYGLARRRLGMLKPSEGAEALLKAASTYGGKLSKASLENNIAARKHQHFGSVIVSCEKADLRPMPDAVYVYSNDQRERRRLGAPGTPRLEVIDELYNAVALGIPPLHDGVWAKDTLRLCLAILESSQSGCEITF